MSKQLLTKTSYYLSSFIGLFFPACCLLCRQQEVLTNQHFCFSCEQQLPYTNYHHLIENDFTDRFWGRIALETGAALFLLRGGSKVQQLIYHLKYFDRPDIGIQLGRLYGRQLLQQSPYSEVDWIVPVPLHAIRLRKRGYNQSTQFAIGLSQSMKIPYNNTALQRIRDTTTQTYKDRLARIENMLSAFRLKEVHPFKNKHILLVDDVLTTGATLEACATQLLEVEGIKISMVTLAIAEF